MHGEFELRSYDDPQSFLPPLCHAVQTLRSPITLLGRSSLTHCLSNFSFFW